MYQYNLGILFENVVETNADKTALRFGLETPELINYSQLNQRVNQIARYLLDVGVGVNDVVCISGDKTLNTFSCMLACLKIGAIYSIFDPESPIERLNKILSVCMPKVIWISNQLSDSLSNTGFQFESKIIINDDKSIERSLATLDTDNLALTSQITGAQGAYIMFTSGSTGFPKGALMTNDNVLNLIKWSIQTYKVSPDDILTNLNPLFFDNSVFDFYTALFSGASLVPLPKEIVTTPQKLILAIDKHKCTLWFSVPSLLIFLDTMKAFSPSNLKSVKRFIFGGEGYPKAKLKKLFDTYGDKSQLYNVYGPTECTCICSSYEISASDFEDLKGFPPLGQICENFGHLILSSDSEQFNDDEIGELCLLGPNVGKGYYNDKKRTEEHFFQNPFNNAYAEIMYKTGDLVSVDRESKKIIIHGRKDNQIKHLGYRIELEEIETALSSIRYISESAVLHTTVRGISQIMAVVSLNEAIQENKLREELQKLIPNYMIPSTFYFEDRLPKNQNGKTDRRALLDKYVVAKDE